MPIRLSLLAWLTFAPSILFAQKPASRAEAESLVASLQYRGGEVSLHNGVARLVVPPDLRYLDGKDSATVLHRLWNNPPSNDTLGMLLPKDVSPIDPSCWAVVMSYEEEGYVKDADAEKIDYEKLLKQMQKDLEASNADRTRQGYSTIALIGWGAVPHYDQSSHKLIGRRNCVSAVKPNTLSTTTSGCSDVVAFLF